MLPWIVGASRRIKLPRLIRFARASAALLIVAVAVAAAPDTVQGAAPSATPPAQQVQQQWDALVQTLAKAVAAELGQKDRLPAAKAKEAGSDEPDRLASVVARLDDEAAMDARAAPEIPAALAGMWRAFDRDGSAGAVAGIAWVVVAAALALAAEYAPALAFGGWRRRRLSKGAGGPTLGGLLALLAADFGGVMVFAIVFSSLRSHWFAGPGAAAALAGFAFAVLLRWRIAVLVARMVLRPTLPVARLVPLGDAEAGRLARLFSAVVLVITILIGFSRNIEAGDLDPGVAHVVSVAVGILVSGLLAFLAIRGRSAVEALIRGERSDDIVGAIRAALARAWVALALIVIAVLMIMFVFDLSLGLLAYHYAATNSLGILFVLVVLEALRAKAWRQFGPAEAGADSRTERAVAETFQRFIGATLLLTAAAALAWTWIAAIGLPKAEASHAVRSVIAATATLLIAYAVWEIARLAINRHMQTVARLPGMPGDGGEGEPPATSRLETVLPFLRAALGIAIAVLAALVVLSRLGVDTAPLIAGAGVFGLAISFGSQSLVRDIISGLFFMWDDAFRVGEYIDTGRLKGTVEGMSIRSVKLRHQNGPLHTIPFGQLLSVSNFSRDWATVKFNLRMDRDCDIELLRKTVKQVGIEMQDNPEIAAEIILPLKLQGIVEVADTALVVRLKFTARPVKPSWLQREYLKRLHAVFAEKGLAFATGALTLALPEGAAAGSPVVTLPAPSRVA